MVALLNPSGPGAVLRPERMAVLTSSTEKGSIREDSVSKS